MNEYYYDWQFDEAAAAEQAEFEASQERAIRSAYTPELQAQMGMSYEDFVRSYDEHATALYGPQLSAAA